MLYVITALLLQKPHKLSTGYLNHHISAKMRLAQLLKVKGTFQPGNHHTPNLPGTKRQVVQKKKCTSYMEMSWRFRLMGILRKTIP